MDGHGEVIFPAKATRLAAAQHPVRRP
jgi:hypothetical protein